MEEEQREPTTTELLNVIKLMELALKYYANEQIYNDIVSHDNAIIMNDKGHLARYTLNQLQSISEYEASLFSEIQKISNQIEESGITETDDFDSEQFKNMINQLKQLNDSIKH